MRLSVAGRRRFPLPAIVGCMIYLAMALIGVSHDSGTYDEFVHVTAGYSYWAFNDYRLNPENGNLAQRIVALPLVVRSNAREAFPTRDQPAWHRSDVWALSDQLFFGPSRNADALLFRARVMVAIVAAILAAVVFCWSRALFGTWGGYVSLALYVFSPTMLANGALATSDLIGAAFFTVALWALWTVLHRITPLNVLMSVAAVGGMFVAKPSAPLIVPIALAMIAVQLLGRQPIVVRLRDERELTSRNARGGAIALLVAVHGFVAWLLIWAAYGFRYSAFAPGSPAGDTLLEPWSSVFEHGSGATSALAQWGRVHHVLPEAYLYGLAVVVEYAKERTAFLNGAVSLHGWRSFFVYTTLYKTTIPGLALVCCAAIAIFAAWRRQRATERATATNDRTLPLYDLAPLLLGVAIYGASAVSSSLNIGHRHLLPIIPLVMILAGAVGPAAAAASTSIWRERRLHLDNARQAIAAIGVVALLVWHAAESIAIAPHYLAYFNQLAGGPSQGYRHFVDSSLDWGQDLPGLKQWLDRAGLQKPNHEPVYLSYFGTAFPSYYGIDALPLPGFPDRSTPQPPRPLAAGVYCFSATMLQSVYSRPGPWNQQYEDAYRQARRNIEAFDATATDSIARQALIRSSGDAVWADEFRNYEQLRTARLAAYLRRHEPDDQVGHSILIYRVSDRDLDRALGRP